MITEMSTDELVELGADLRASYLVQQTGYTLGIAARDGEALTALLEEPTLLDETAAQKAQVETAMKDKELMAAESKSLTNAQDEKVREAKIWRRKVVMRGKRAQRRGRTVPDDLVVIGRATSVPQITGQLTTMTASFESNLAALGGDRARPLLEEGKTILAELSRTDSEQEVALITALPEKVRKFYIAKGTLYIALKQINDAGHELHADDLHAAAAYNLSILRRRAGRRAAGGGADGGGDGGDGA